MLELNARPFLAFFVLLMTFAAQSEQNTYGRYSGPHALGPFNLDRNVFLSTLLANLGTKVSGSGTYCFADKEDGSYLNVQAKDDQSARVASVSISSFPNCVGLPVIATRVDPHVWKTPQRIGLGSTKEEVVHAYGEPVSVRKLDRKSDVGVVAGVRQPGSSGIAVGDSSFLYSCLVNEKEGCSNDLRATRFGFSNDKVVWISASRSE